MPEQTHPKETRVSKSLFSQHYLQQRLAEQPEWVDDPTPAFARLQELWRRAQQFGGGWNEAQTEEEFIKPVLAEVLGWHYSVQTKVTQRGQLNRPDYTLFVSRAVKDEAEALKANEDAYFDRAAAIAEAKYWGRSLSGQGEQTRDSWKADRNPSHQMVGYLVGSRVEWGILTNGQVWRLYSREVSSTASEFYEIDLNEIFVGVDPRVHPQSTQDGQVARGRWQVADGEGEAQGQAPTEHFKRWWLFFRRDAFVPGRGGESFVQRVHRGSNTYAREISEKLKEIVFEEVMPAIAGGFVAYRHHEQGIGDESPESLDQIYRASLSLLYKLLFLLYAEARNLLPLGNEAYRHESLTEMARRFADWRDRQRPISTATHATIEYGRLLALFHRVDRGDPSLGVPRYNGGLFKREGEDNRFLEAHRLSDWAVAEAVDLLVRDRGEPVDYAFISVRNLGSIYEGLLENKLRVVDAAAGKVELINDKGERKASGSYYTPDYIVEYIVAQTLDPILDERQGRFAAALDQCVALRRRLLETEMPGINRRLRQELEKAERLAREAFLGIKVCDPAMGSGHFLVNAVDHLTDGIIERMGLYHNAHPDVPLAWNPIYALIDRVREEILDEMRGQGIAIDRASLDDTALLTRLVMKRCIYGVDLNRMAVELAKLSLWLHSFTVGAPLSFLDHHLRWGNSLIGVDVRTVQAEIERNGAQMNLFGGPFAGLLDLTAIMVEVVDGADATLADVGESARRYGEFQALLTPYKQVLDLWVSHYFGNRAALELMTLYSDALLAAVKREHAVSDPYAAAIERSKTLWAEKRFFHWDLEFPEVFIDLERRDWAENPGFDAVIGNPPYVRSLRLKEADPDTWNYYPLRYQVAAKREYDIYLCFVEAGGKMLNRQGRSGMILPNKWFTTRVGEALRTLLSQQRTLAQLVDYGNYQVFKDVTTYVCLLFLSGTPQDEFRVATLNSAKEIYEPLPGGAGDWQMSRMEINRLGADAWMLAAGFTGKILQRWKALPKLRSIATIFSGTGTRADPVFQMERDGDRYYSRALGHWVEIEHGIMRPSLTGRDIDPYYCDEHNYLLFPYQLTTDESILLSPQQMQERYPKAWAYLNTESIRKILEARDSGKYKHREDWYCFSYPRNMHLLGLSKLVLPDVAGRAEFTLDRQGRYIIDTVYGIRLNEGERISLEALTALLNSQIMTFFLQQTGTDLRGGYFRMKTAYLNPFPIPHFDFTTPEAERARYGEQAQTCYARCLQTGDPTPILAFVDRHLAGESPLAPRPSPRTDVVHDLLAFLADRMIDLNRAKQAEMKGFLTWLARHLRADLDQLTGKSKLQNYPGDYQKGQPPLAFEELLDLLVKNRRKLGVDPLGRNIQSTLEREYSASLGKLLPIKDQLTLIDRLIDEIVYRLYGLSDDEIRIVEGRR